ncbi:hypothetical protein X742_21725 [Mesorhizobium sp. LNHC232B00]|nr:hypothetical protein X742_21725 [Mesorhizobium sp. LNHC232B00]
MNWQTPRPAGVFCRWPRKLSAPPGAITGFLSRGALLMRDGVKMVERAVLNCWAAHS